jgi:hypothetical protein
MISTYYIAAAVTGAVLSPERVLYMVWPVIRSGRTFFRVIVTGNSRGIPDSES